MNDHRRRRITKRLQRYQQRRRQENNASVTSSTHQFLLHISSVVLVVVLFVSQKTRAQDVQLSDNYYCGKSWPDAAQNCHKHCPSGAHSECADLGNSNSPEDEEWKCYTFTGCYVEPVDEEDDPSGGDVPNNNQYCGLGWINAMVTCSKPCPGGSECTGPDTCYGKSVIVLIFVASLKPYSQYSSLLQLQRIATSLYLS